MNEFSPSPAPDREHEALVDEAVRLVRDQPRAESDGEATLRRLHASYAQVSARSRKRRTQLAVGLAATFVLSTAFAWYRMSALERATSTRAPAPAAATDFIAPAAAPPAPTERPSSMDAQQRLAEEAVRAPSSTREPRKPLRRHDASRTTDSASVPAPAAPVVGPTTSTTAPMRVSAEQQRTLYMTAHQLHFRGAPQAALSAWDAYLATDPVGSLAVEARYNRAVVLARLGQREAARAALAPFADGTYGTFRRADASVLLKQLQ